MIHNIPLQQPSTSTTSPQSSTPPPLPGTEDVPEDNDYNECDFGGDSSIVMKEEGGANNNDNNVKEDEADDDLLVNGETLSNLVISEESSTTTTTTSTRRIRDSNFTTTTTTTNVEGAKQGQEDMGGQSSSPIDSLSSYWDTPPKMKYLLDATLNKFCRWLRIL